MSDVLRIHHILDYWALTQPDAELAIFEGRLFTYGEAKAFVDRLAVALSRDLQRGDRVGVLSKNTVEMGLVYFAASKAGVVPVPLNYRLAAPEWDYIVQHSEVKLILAEAIYQAKLNDLKSVGELDAGRVAFDEAARGWTDLADWAPALKDGAVLEERPHHELLQMYTSGTTGLPKGAVLGVESVHALIDQWQMCFRLLPNERLLQLAPMYHVSGTFHFFHAIAAGASLYMMQNFDARKSVEALANADIAMAYFVPTMLQACLEVPTCATQRYPSLRLISYGGSPIALPVLEKALEVFDCDFVQAFGMTECPNFTYLTPADHRRAIAGEPGLLETCGRVGPGSEMRIIDKEGNELPAGQVGEICGRGPQIMLGYWRQEDATARALRDGWMHTGDAGYVDSGGYLYVKDRMKDMIVSGAENIYPREVEQALLRHPNVADVAVIGVPSERWGEEVKAFVILRSGSNCTSDDLIVHCRRWLAGYKRPQSIEFITELPRNPSGKVLKRELRKPYWEGRNRFVS